MVHPAPTRGLQCKGRSPAGPLVIPAVPCSATLSTSGAYTTAHKARPPAPPLPADLMVTSGGGATSSSGGPGSPRAPSPQRQSVFNQLATQMGVLGEPGGWWVRDGSSCFRHGRTAENQLLDSRLNQAVPKPKQHVPAPSCSPPSLRVCSPPASTARSAQALPPLPATSMACTGPRWRAARMISPLPGCGCAAALWPARLPACLACPAESAMWLPGVVVGACLRPDCWQPLLHAGSISPCARH